MKFWSVAAGVAGAAGIAAAGAARHHRQVISRRGAGDAYELGSLHAPGRTVIASDGVPLHVEIEEAPEATCEVSLVFVHGYSMTQDCWHFQRAGYRGQVRAVFYDQRSHGRSGRSSREHATVEQLGQDLADVIEQTCPSGQVVVIGHSMGGMSLIALADQRPEFVRERVAGVALISTTAGGLKPSRLVLPLLPASMGSKIGLRVMSTLGRGATLVDGVRRAGRDLTLLATERYAFGGEVPASYITFVDSMLGATPFEVLADFFPTLNGLDKFDALAPLSQVPTLVLCGTDDKITPVGHSRKLHKYLPESMLVECAGAGHMVILESHDLVNAELDQLIAAANDPSRRPPRRRAGGDSA